MYFCRAYTRGLCARCVPRSVDRDGQARPQHDHETKPNHLHLGHIHRRGVYIPGKNTLTNNTGYEHPRRTAAPGGGGGLSPIPRGVVSCAGPAPAARGLSFAGTRERHYRSAITRPRARERRSDDETRSGGAGGKPRGGEGERRRARTTNRAGKRIMTHTQPNARFFRFSGWNPLLINSEFRREISVF